MINREPLQENLLHFELNSAYMRVGIMAVVFESDNTTEEVASALDRGGFLLIVLLPLPYLDHCTSIWGNTRQVRHYRGGRYC